MVATGCEIRERVNVDYLRKHYYNCMLDPHCQAKMTDKMRAAVEDDRYEDGGELQDPDEDHPANLVSSLCEDGLHRPALDIDIPCIRVDSSTPGHSHLYFTVGLEWDEYVELLQALAKAGILEQKYVDHSLGRGQTLLRVPGTKRHFGRLELPVRFETEGNGEWP